MPNPPNVLFLLSDEHSHRCLSAMPPEVGEPVRTPTLDGLLAHGAFLRRTYCQMPLCTPSRMCLMSSREVEECGAWNNSSILDPELPTIGSTFTAAGYETCLAGKLHFGGTNQYAGFKHRPYGDFGGPCSHQPDPLSGGYSTLTGMRNRTALAGLSDIPECLLQERAVVTESVAWLREQTASNPDTPWLLNASFSRPHFPLTAPRRHFERYWPAGITSPKVGRTGDSAQHPMTEGMAKGFQVDEIGPDELLKARAAYFACVDFLDEILGDFLALLDRDGLLDNTIIVYTSDHGELAGEHGLWWKNSWHEAASRVPWIVSLPEHRRGELAPSVSDTAASLADLLPTLCGLTGVPTPDTARGTDQATVVRGGTEPTRRRPVTCQALTPRWGAGTEFRMMVIDNLKYVAFRDAPDLLFDLAADPLEQHDLSLTHPRAAELRACVLEGFDFDLVEASRKAGETALKEQYSTSVKPRTPNQVRLGDGRLIEADRALYDPEVVTDDPRREFR